MRLTAVCDVPPPDGIEPRNAPTAFAAPVASSSRLGRGGGSSLRDERAADGHRLREAHERDAERAGPHLLRKSQIQAW